MTVAPDFLATFPDVVATRIKAELTGLRTCEAIAGSFDVEELRRTGKAAPAVLVALLNITQAATPSWPQLEYRLSMAAFIVTKSAIDLKAAPAGMSIAQVLLSLLPEQTFDLPEAGPADTVAASTLVTKETRAEGVHLMAVTWSQPVILLGLQAAQIVPLSVYVSRAPDIGLAHEGDYTLISAEGAP